MAQSTNGWRNVQTTRKTKSQPDKDVKTPFQFNSESIPRPKGAWLFAAKRGKTAKAASPISQLLSPANRTVQYTISLSRTIGRD